MKLSSNLRGLLSLTGLATAVSLSALTASATAAVDEHQGKAKATNNAYIVQMAEMPVSAYKGSIKGYSATKPNKGQKIDPNAPAVVSYMAYLASRQDAALASVGGSKKLYNYGYVFSGFAAELTAAQAEKLASMPGVLAVTKDEAYTLDTASTPAFLGLSQAAPDGFWARTGATGENVIIAIIDTGAWPEHPSFSDRTGSNGNATKDGKLSYHQIPGWNGRCVPGEAFTGTDCNQKLIGARYYNAGFGGNAGVDATMPWEFNSARDYGGHGTHTASTAGGNANVAATGQTAVFGNISGIAPRARIAAYKVCWQTPTGGSCFGSDSVAAIDQAVADGVDVINYSISGSRTNFRDPVEIAFLFAADAGVFVAASAGNSGPASSTVAHPGPWLTTVAAGTHNRNGTGSVTLGNGATYAGASFAAALGSSPLVDAVNVGASGASATNVELCFPGALNPAAVAGKIVLCKRGAIALVDKSRAVFEAGGVGAIIYNDPAGGTNTLALMHPVPTVHMIAASGLLIKSYIGSAGASATASIAQSTILFNVAAPFTASFSSRGPLQAAGGDLLKPDIIAPGQDVLAGVAPPGNNGRLFDLYSGTSMSSPHVAGLAALLKQLHPSWSPMAIKSALMTSAGDVRDGPNTNPLVIFRQGAGHVRPNSAANPGLVFDSGFNDWLGFLCGTQLPTSFCTSAGVAVLDPSNLNVASIAIGDMAGVQTVTRRVTNVGGAAATYTPTYTGMTGFTVAVSPTALTLAAGETKPFTVTFTRTTAALGAYTGGQLTLSDGAGGHSVRVPMVVRPVALAAPAQVSGSYSVTFGYAGAFTATPRGLIAATTTPGAVATGGSVDFSVTVPAGATYARFSLFDTAVSQASDLDLEVYNAAGALVGASGGATTAEEVNLVNPAAGIYTVRVVGYLVPVGSATFTLFNWGLGTANAGNMVLTAPASATIGATGAISITATGLTAGTKYLGSVAYGGTAGLPNPTIVRMDP